MFKNTIFNLEAVEVQYPNQGLLEYFPEWIMIVCASFGMD